MRQFSDGIACIIQSQQTSTNMISEKKYINVTGIVMIIKKEGHLKNVSKFTQTEARCGKSHHFPLVDPYTSVGPVWAFTIH